MAHLFQLVKGFLQAENFHVFGKKVQNFSLCEFQTGEDIFQFFNRLDQTVENVQRLEHVARDFGETIKIPNFMIMQKMFSAITRVPEFSHFVENLIMTSPKGVDENDP